MKLKFTIEEGDQRKHTSEIDLPALFCGFDEICKSFQLILDYYHFKHDDWKARYIEKWGQSTWDKNFGDKVSKLGENK